MAKKTNAGPKKPSQNGSTGPEELTKLFTDQLKDLLNAEKQLVKALPKMARAATSRELKTAFSEHLTVTQKQVTRMEQVFAAIGKKPVSKKCEAMEGLIKEGEEAIEETDSGSLVRDVALIIAAQKVEHYEMAGYGSVRSIAALLGHKQAAKLLQQTLDEEGEADKLLTKISEGINVKAYEKEE